MSFEDAGTETEAETDPAANKRYAEERVDALLAATIEGAGVVRLEHVRDDLVDVYVAAINDGTYSQLDTAMYEKLQWVAEQLHTERRRDVFEQTLMYVNTVWEWMNRWQGFTPGQVGEDPYVLPAEAAYAHAAEARELYLRDHPEEADTTDSDAGDGWDGGSAAFQVGSSSYDTGEGQEQEQEQ